MRVRLGVVLSVLCAASLWFGTAASAEVRTVTFTDPQDAPPALSGPKDEDVQSATISYDTTGQVAVSIRFYEPVFGRLRGLALVFGLSPAIEPDGQACDLGGAFANGHLSISVGAVASGFLNLSTATGQLQPTSTSVQPDRLGYSVVFSHPLLANQNWRCADVYALLVFFYEFSWCAEPSCPITSSVVDRVQRAAWFPGFAPKPLVEQIRPYWQVTARRASDGLLLLRVRNRKVPSLFKYRACIGLRNGGRRCHGGTLIGADVDLLTFAFDKRVLRPLPVTIYVGGRLQYSRRVLIQG